MQVFKAFFKVLKNKIPSAMIYVSVFIVISIIMTRGGSSEIQFEASRLKVCVFDNDNTAASAALVDYIGKNHDLVELDNDEDVILDSLFYGNVDYVLTINAGYSDKLSHGDTDELFTNYHVHDSYDAVFMNNLLDEYVKTVNAYTTGGFELSKAVESAAGALSYQAEVRIVAFDDDSSAGSSGDMSSASMYFQYLPYIFISVMIAALCPVLMTMNRKDIRHRTNCSCVTIASSTMQILAGSAVFITAIWLIFMIAGAMLNGGIYSGKGWLAVLNSFVFTLIAADFAILLSSFEVSDTAVNVINQVLGLGMSFLCGVFVPLSLLDDSVISVARLLPVYWYVRINNMLSGAEVYDASLVKGFMLIELAYAAVLAVVTLLVRRLKYSGGVSKANN